MIPSWAFIGDCVSWLPKIWKKVTLLRGEYLEAFCELFNIA